jgi:hypothetical protein
VRKNDGRLIGKDLQISGLSADEAENHKDLMSWPRVTPSSSRVSPLKINQLSRGKYPNVLARKIRARNQLGRRGQSSLFDSIFLLGLLLCPEDGGEIFLRNIG